VTRALTEAEFLKDVAAHQMTVLLDNGLYRHLHFSAGGFNQWFEIITWPGRLAIAGDMGDFVFERLEDMFEFFRGKDAAGPLRINPSYSAEKVQAACKRSGVTKYSEEAFRTTILERVEGFLEDDDTGVKDELRSEVEHDVLSYADEGEDSARRAAGEFKWNGREVFTDFWEADLHEYTLHFLWCLYAIAWAIRIYDSSKPDLMARAA
jgi:hypothetical protein